MCGIAGLVGGDAIRHRTTVQAMGLSQHYRGPDGTMHAAASDGRAVLAMNTLLIVDPQAVPGPTWTARAGSCWPSTVRSATSVSRPPPGGIRLAVRESDAHFLLRAWTKPGPACLDGLDGMFGARWGRCIAGHSPAATTSPSCWRTSDGWSKQNEPIVLPGRPHLPAPGDVIGGGAGRTVPR
ncbi:hypothetical protein ABZ208_34205 [Streptomyces sp. NPDC006208]|uniref:hypothetical protein n=1 Tax=Streptomyces sp. NPDC006208 TaxID=3156734 RepID=UPI0033B2DD4C